MRSLTLALALVLALGPGAEAWTVRMVARPDGPGTVCVLESGKVTLSDGYQTTSAQVVVDGDAVSVTSASILDPGFHDLGIVVDDQPLVPMDELAGPRAARFRGSRDRLVELFKAGTRATLHLRFWPTWPTTGSHSAPVSLIGFTRAYAQLEACR